jgi:hypothetical protein
VRQSGCCAVRAQRPLLLTLFPHTGDSPFPISQKSRETFVKRTFARWRALPLRRDVTRVRYDANGFRALAIWLQRA